ncbi:hypothetical protein [Sphingomonas guangdongensis]|nr:hypothetical protein [Sphingomonas guangdongensis]
MPDANRTTSSAPTMRQPWTAPTVHKLAARSAENGLNPVISDGPFSMRS